MATPTDRKFAIYAEATDQQRPLIMTGLTFARLIDDVVHPFEADKPFFVDGAPLMKPKIKRIKILQQSEFLERNLAELHHMLKVSSDAQK
jgi:hypothetical protein